MVRPPPDIDKEASRAIEAKRGESGHTNFRPRRRTPTPCFHIHIPCIDCRQRPRPNSPSPRLPSTPDDTGCTAHHQRKSVTEPKLSSLVISAISEDRTGVVSDVSQTVFESGCNIEESRMSVLGGEFALIMLVSGKWNAVAKLENALDSLRQNAGIALTHKRTESRTSAPDQLPYAIDVVALDQSGLVHKLTNFFALRSINIQEMHTNCYAAAHTGTPMFAVHMDIGIPASTHVASLRDEFLEHCDRMNVDAVLEPIKS